MGDPQPLQELVASDALLLTPEEAARVLRVGRTTIYGLIKAGELRSLHIGAAVAWPVPSSSATSIASKLLLHHHRLGAGAEAAELPRTRGGCSTLSTRRRMASDLWTSRAWQPSVP